MRGLTTLSLQRHLTLKAALEYSAALAGLLTSASRVTQHEPFTWQKYSPSRRVPRTSRQGYAIYHVNASMSFLDKRMKSWLSRPV